MPVLFLPESAGDILVNRNGARLGGHKLLATMKAEAAYVVEYWVTGVKEWRIEMIQYGVEIVNYDISARQPSTHWFSRTL